MEPRKAADGQDRQSLKVFLEPLKAFYPPPPAEGSLLKSIARLAPGKGLAGSGPGLPRYCQIQR